MLNHNLLIAAIAAMALLLCGSAPGRRPQPNPVAEVLEKHIRALGEKTALERMSTLVLKGTAELTTQGQKYTGTTERFVKFPDKILVRLNFPALKMTSGLDGRAGWKDIGPNIAAMNDWEVDFIQRNNLLFGPLKQVEQFTSAYRSLKIKPSQRIDNRDLKIVEGEPWHGEIETLYFDAATGLLYRWDVVNEGDQSQKILEQLYADEYTTVEGIKIPRAIRAVMANATMRTTFTEIKLNVPIDDAVFVKPR
jgi:hypothetical protein